MRNQIQFICAPVILALAACSSSGGKVDIGSDQHSTVAQSLADYAGQWDGYVEAYQFATGTDRVRVTLDAEGQGTLEVGDAPAFAPASDPNVGYPDPNAPFDDMSYMPSFSLPLPGFGYPVHDAVIETGRIRFTVWATDIVGPWCEMQQSYLSQTAFPESYACTIGGGGYVQASTGCFSGDGTLDPRPQLDCGQAKTCSMGCECTASECHARRGSDEIRLDGALAGSGDELVGTLVLSGSRVTVRMTRGN